MQNLLRFRKKLFMKSTAVAILLCLMIANMSIYVYADENTEGLHNTTKNENINQDNAEDTTIETGSKESDSEKDISNTDLEENNETQDNTAGKDKNDDSDDNAETEEKKDEEIDDSESKDEEIEDSELKEENDNKKDTVSGNDIGDIEDIEKEESEETEENNEEQELPEIINVVVPTTYTLALNPYGLPIRIDKNTITTEQVISRMYGIVNKSSTDQIVTVSLTVEDRNGGEIIFVDSAEEAENAEENVYAIYLEAVPADEEQILIDGKTVDSEVTGESLRKVEMTGAKEHAITLHDGMNKMAFKLFGAVYNDDNELMKLAPDGKGVSAYTFSGIMNPNAEWEKLSGGIKLSVVYTYQTADGSEKIIEGTGAMIYTD